MAECVKQEEPDNETQADEEVDRLMKAIPSSVFETFRYYDNHDSALSSVLEIAHRNDRFEFNIALGDIDKTGLYLCAKFVESVLITRVGITAVERYNDMPEIKVEVYVRRGEVSTIRMKKWEPYSTGKFHLALTCVKENNSTLILGEMYIPGHMQDIY